MDTEDALKVFLIFATVLLIRAMVLATLQILGEPLRAEKANLYCQERGYREYQDYQSYVWSDQVYGVRCRTNTVDVGITQNHVEVQNVIE